MKALLFISVLLFSSLVLHAQNVNFAWSKQIGSTGFESGNSITHDLPGNIYTTGNFTNTVDFDPGTGVFNLIAGNSYNTFISKLNANGDFLWAKQLAAGTATDYSYGSSITTDIQGNIYVTGAFAGTVDFDPGSSTFNVTANNEEAFVLKLDMNGNFAWVKQLGESSAGTSQGRGSSILLDFSGICIAGTYHGVGDFDPGPGTFNIGVSTASSCMFVTKLDLNGNFVWTKATEGGTFSPNIAMALDNADNIIVTGGFVGITDFDPGIGTFTLVSTSVVSTNIFILKLDASGTFIWAKMMLGGPGFGASVATDNAGNIYSTGKFAGTVDFDPNAGVSNLAYTGTADIYISVLSAAGNFISASQLGGNSDSEGTGIVLDGTGNIYITGTFSGTVDFDPGTIVYNLTSSGDADIFVAKINVSSGLSWAVNMGKTGKARANSIITDVLGNVYTTGNFDSSVDFDFSGNDYTLTSNGSGDIFIDKISNCEASANTIIATACNSYTWNAQIYFASGTYIQVLTNAGGCDSIVTLDLTIGIAKTLLDVTTCDSYLWNGQIYNSSGTYADTLTTANGCDSIVTLNLVIRSDAVSIINDTICPGDNYYGYTKSGTYTNVFSSGNGCDSTRTLNLFVKNSCIPMSIPNAFTPNNDTYNDIFKPTITEDIAEYSLIIFNRFGQKLFESRSYSFGWDGKCKGKIQPVGSYIYIIRYRNKQGFLTEEKGSFLLLQ